MDAVTLVAAAVAIAIENSRDAALEECLLDRERQAMRAADLESQIAFRTDMGHSRGAVYGAGAAYSARFLLRPNLVSPSRRNWLEAERQLAWLESDSDAEPVVQNARQPALDLQLVQRCAGCGSTGHLEVLLPTGRWANAPMEQRLFCDVCIEAAAAP